MVYDLGTNLESFGSLCSVIVLIKIFLFLVPESFVPFLLDKVVLLLFSGLFLI